MFRLIIEAIAKKILRKLGVEMDHKTPQSIMLKPDGTWCVINSTTPPPTIKYSSPNITQHQIVPGKDYRYYDSSDSVQKLTEPPECFPHAQQLNLKLKHAQELDIITNCCHKQTGNGVYILSIEIPFKTTKMDNINNFVAEMESSYKLKAIQKERINSVAYAENYYRIIFEYDSRIHVISKLKGDV